VTAKQQVVRIPHQGEEGINGYGRKYSDKKERFLKSVKMPLKMSTTTAGSEHNDGEELGDQDAPD